MNEIPREDLPDAVFTDAVAPLCRLASHFALSPGEWQGLWKVEVPRGCSPGECSPGECSRHPDPGQAAVAAFFLRGLLAVLEIGFVLGLPDSPHTFLPLAVATGLASRVGLQLPALGVAGVGDDGVAPQVEAVRSPF